MLRTLLLAPGLPRGKGAGWGKEPGRARELPALLCREYLAIFKKTVAMHEVFLQRLAAHPTLRRDHNFFVFLEYGQDVSWATELGSPRGWGARL